MDWTKNDWEIRERLRRIREQMEYEADLKKAAEEEHRQQQKREQQASIDPMEELAKLANSTHAVFEHVYFENGWGCYIARNGGEQRFRFTQIQPGRRDGLHYTQPTPVQVVREMFKVSQYA